MRSTSVSTNVSHLTSHNRGAVHHGLLDPYHHVQANNRQIVLQPSHVRKQKSCVDPSGIVEAVVKGSDDSTDGSECLVSDCNYHAGQVLSQQTSGLFKGLVLDKQTQSHIMTTKGSALQNSYKPWPHKRFLQSPVLPPEWTLLLQQPILLLHKWGYSISNSSSNPVESHYMQSPEFHHQVPLQSFFLFTKCWHTFLHRSLVAMWRLLLWGRKFQ